MKKKILAGIVALGLLTGGVFGSYAWFTSQAGSTENVFKTGVLKITGPGTIVQNVDFKNIYPGWQETKQVTIKNEGSIDFKYRMSVAALAGNILYDGATPLEVSVSGGDFKNINDLGYVNLATVAAGAQHTFDVTFKLPVAANNDYQNKNATFSLAFEATQAQNPAFDVKSADLINVIYFSNRNDAVIQGYDLGFTLNGIKSEEIASAQVNVYKGTTLLAVNKSKNIFTDYPNSAAGYSTPFDVDGSFLSTNDTAWTYGQWLGLSTDVPTKAVVTVKMNDGRVCTVTKDLAQ